MKLLIIAFITILTATNIISQKGKNGNLTINNKTIVNEFAYLLNDANAGDVQITTSQTTLNDNNRFVNSLSKGDLLLIIQMQGASLNASAEPWTGNGIYGLPISPQWGEITNYNNCGNYEFVEVVNINSSSVITIRCGLQKNYTAIGKTQIVRVPRLETLTINDTLTTQQWNGSTGGICVVETNNDIIINANGVIHSTGLGFRGGVSSLRSNIWGAGDYASINQLNGGMKGEGIAGYTNDYTPMGGQYGKGAAANAGGGSTSHNSGGGGGANAGDISNWQNGVGNPNPIYNTAWGLETPSISNTTASGGGRGGYTYSSSNQNANTTAPGNSAWGSDSRRNQGGLGGRPLDYSLNKLFFGGGGGAGEINDSENQGANGGNAGGLIFIKTFGNITGTGKIETNGNNGQNIFTNNPPTFGYAGNDGAGGAGAGGTIKIENLNTSSIGNINISANGGNGGNQQLQKGVLYVNAINEAEGPGGGGGGGYVSIPTNTANISVNGGTNGTTNSDALSEFPPNGATSGGVGIVASSNNIIDLIAQNDTICMGENTTLNATSTNTLPQNYNITWYDNNYNMISVGNSFTTGTITNDTVFYVGICPGNTSIEVKVVIESSFVVDTSNVIVTNEHCDQSNGSISGISITGGVLPLSYSWNGNTSSSTNINNLNQGSYQLTITDNNGCSSNVGTFYISNIQAPIIDSVNHTIQNEICGNSNGAILGLSIQGGTPPYNYYWNGVSSALPLSNISEGIYNLIVVDSLGCKDSSLNYIVNNIPPPNIDTSSMVIIPESCENSNGSISNITINEGTSPFSYNWSNNYNSLNINGLSYGNYTLIVTDANNCKDTISVNVNNLPLPTAGFIISDSIFNLNDIIYINNSSSNNVVGWNYNFDNGNYDSISNTNTFYTIPGEYTICQNVIDNNGCEDNYCHNIYIIENNLPIIIPNVITPNRDNNNDLFIIKNKPENMSLKIIDRWGIEVFEDNNYKNDWKGVNKKGLELPEGTYYYIIKYKTDTKTGFFNLIR